MKTIAILDVETTGLDPLENRIIEIAVILYDLLLAAPITSFSAIVSKEENLAVHINGISAELAQEMTDIELSKKMISHLLDRSDAIVTHGVEFDKNFVLRDTNFNINLSDKPWVCSLEHIKWPRKTDRRSLMAIAVGHDVAIVAAHRAMTDCDILARLFTRANDMGINLVELMKNAMRPRVLVQALVDYEDRQLAKDAHFNWDNNSKKWLKEIPEEDIESLPFQCRILQKH